MRRRDRSGSHSVEYALVLTLVAAVLVLVIWSLGAQVSTALSKAASALGG